MKRLVVVLCVLSLSVPAAALAASLSSEKAGQLTAEMDSRKKDLLDKEFKGKDPSKMNSNERRDYQKKSDAIEKEVLQENKVSKGEYSATMMRATKNSPTEKARDDHAKKIEADKKAAAEAEKQKQAEAQKGSEQGEVVVERGDQEQGRAMSVESGVMVDRGSDSGGSFGGF